MQCKGGCGFFGSESCQGYCSVCAKKLGGVTGSTGQTIATPTTVSLNVKLSGKEDIPCISNIPLSISISSLMKMVQCVTDVKPKNQRLMIFGKYLEPNKKLSQYAPKDGMNLWVYDMTVSKDDNGHYMDEQVKMISVRDNQEKNEIKIYPINEEEKKNEEYQTECYWCETNEKEEKGEKETECKFCEGKKKLKFAKKVEDTAPFAGDLTDVEIVISINCSVHPHAYGINLENLISNVVLVSKSGSNIPLEVVTNKSDSNYNTNGDVKMVFKVKRKLEPTTHYLFKIDATINAGIRRGTFAPENSVYFNRFLSGVFSTK